MINDINKIIELKSFALHVEEVRKRGDRIKREIMNISYQTLILKKNEILEVLKNVKYNDLKDLVYRMRLSFDEIIDILELKYFPTERIGYSLIPGIYEVIDLNNSLKYFLPNNVKVNITIDDIRIKSKLKANQTLIFTERSFFYTIFGFTQSHSHPLDYIDGFYWLIAGSYKSDKPFNITGIDKIHLKCDCIQGSIVNGIREPILYSFALSPPPSQKFSKNLESNFLKK